MPLFGLAFGTLLLPSAAQANDVCTLGLGGAAFTAVSEMSIITGNLAIGPKGIQNFADGKITGTYFVDPTANNSHSNNVQINGGVVIAKNGELVAVANLMTYLSSLAATYTPTTTYNNVLIPPNITNSYTITGTNPPENRGLNIINLNSINLTGDGQYLTLTGSQYDYFLINVSGSIKLTHQNGGIKVQGIDASHVLFNITSYTNDGLKVSGNAKLAGTYLAPNAGITLSPAILDGEVISGKNISLTSGVSITQNPFIPPSFCYKPS
jgi:choice-of-anchor A domain-containing protein